MNENEKIRQVRKTLKISQQEAADVLGVSKQYLSKVENGLTELSKEKMALFCSKYNVSMDWLLLDKGNIFFGKDEDEEYGAVLAKETEDVFKFDAALKFFSLYINEAIYLIKEKYPNALYEDITEASRQLYIVDTSFYDDIYKFEADIKEFNNRGKKYKLFKERIFTAYNRTIKKNENNKQIENTDIA